MSQNTGLLLALILTGFQEAHLLQCIGCIRWQWLWLVMLAMLALVMLFLCLASFLSWTWTPSYCFSDLDLEESPATERQKTSLGVSVRHFYWWRWRYGMVDDGAWLFLSQGKRKDVLGAGWTPTTKVGFHSFLWEDLILYVCSFDLGRPKVVSPSLERRPSSPGSTQVLLVNRWFWDWEWKPMILNIT